MSRTLQIDALWRLRTPDQTLLPFEERWMELDSAEACRGAIVLMQVRGAPLIGAVGAFGLAFALREDPGDAGLERAMRWLGDARPTAVNLRWALNRIRDVVAPLAPGQRALAAWDEAQRLCEDDVRCNQRIGVHGADLLKGLARGEGQPLQILTHCNAGALATIDHGTALAPIFQLHATGIAVHVWVDETRPRNQGALLTAWELARAGVPHTVIADNAGGLLMWQGRVDAVITGCDRVAANGDVANKIGTYLKALAASDNGIPFYVACPLSTIDAATDEGSGIEIEIRSPREITHARGRSSDGRVSEFALMEESSPALNPGFDITPARLVSGLISEIGLIAPGRDAIAAALHQAQTESGRAPGRNGSEPQQ
jgi:methylthioribose-1-phosphate isomerase